MCAHPNARGSIIRPHGHPESRAAWAIPCCGRRREPSIRPTSAAPIQQLDRRHARDDDEYPASASRRPRCTKACGCSSRASRRGRRGQVQDRCRSSIPRSRRSASDRERTGKAACPSPTSAATCRAARESSRALDRRGKPHGAWSSRLSRARGPARDRSSRRSPVLRPDAVAGNAGVPRGVRPILVLGRDEYPIGHQCLIPEDASAGRDIAFTAPPLVTLRNAPGRPYDGAIAAARTCYSPRVVAADEITARQRETIGPLTFEGGHHTVFQHAHFEFGLENVSRQFVWSFLHSTRSTTPSSPASASCGSTRCAPSCRRSAARRARLRARDRGRLGRLPRLTELLKTTPGASWASCGTSRRRATRSGEERRAEAEKKAIETARYVIPWPPSPRWSTRSRASCCTGCAA